jgi:hypothetical protein
VLRIVERVMREGEIREGTSSADRGPEDARAMLRSWITGMDLEVDELSLLELLKEGAVGHADLQRRGRRIHERKLASAVDAGVAAIAGTSRVDPYASAAQLFEACLPAIPYAAACAFLGREKFKLTRADGDRPRVALIADGIGHTHGVTHTIAQIANGELPDSR